MTNSITYAGLGNIGGYCADLVARGGQFQRITLIDHDEYESHNLSAQNISRKDVGRYKVDVVGERISSINPGMEVEVIAKPVQRVPVGRLMADLIATGFDSLPPRRWTCRTAFRLGVPLVDAGVRAEGQLIRIDSYIPSPEEACVECGWSEQERAIENNHYPCSSPVQSAPTGAPAYLGQIAAGWQYKECVALLEDDRGAMRSGYQVLLDGASNRAVVSTRRRSADCTFDHRYWSIRPLAQPPGSVTLSRALRLGPATSGEARLRVYDETFVHRLTCPQCNRSRRVLHLAGRMDESFRRCRHCGAGMDAPGLYITDTLARDQLRGLSPHLSLYSLGIRTGDLFSVETPLGDVHYMTGGG